MKKIAPEARAMYERRQARDEHPSGKFDNGGRWYPSDEEECGCCGSVRSPSRAWPYSYMTHCRSLHHCQKLWEKQHPA